MYLTANVTTTGLRITVNNGATLDLATFTFATIDVLAGSGTIKIRAGYFPTATTNTFVSSSASGATVNYYDFTGGIPTSINYPNLTFSNSTTTDYTISFANTAGNSFTVFGNLITTATSSGALNVRLGTQAGNVLTLTVQGNITIGAGTLFGAGIFNSIHNLSIEGNFTNNGTVQFSNSAQYTASSNGAVRLTFTGATDRTLACQGTTNLYTITIDKGVGSTNILSVTSTNVANLGFYSNGQLITVTRGTLRLGANIDIPRVYGSGTSNYDLGSPGLSPMIWIDGATVNTNGAALVVYGKLRLTSGSFTSLGGQGTVIREEGQYIIEGGTFTTEKFRPSSTASTHRGTFMMTGGVFNAIGTGGSDGAYARFSLPYPEQVFIMTGGTINIRNSQSSTGALHIGSNAASYSVTGGTINVILSGTGGSFPLLSTAPLWNLTISRVAGATPTAVTLANIGSISGATNTAKPLVVQNDFIIEGANTPQFVANNLDVTVGGDFVVQSGAVYTPGNNTTTFDGSDDQAFDISGTITSGLNNLVVSKPSGTITLTGSNSSLIVRGVLTLSSGILNDGGKVIQARASVQNDAVHTGTGSVTLNGSSTQVISGDGTGVFGNLVLDNSSNPGATLASDITVSGTLTLAGAGNSLFDIGPYELWLSSTSSSALTTTGAGFSSSKMIRTQGLQSDRGLRKSFGNLTAFTYHMGSGTSYTPATLQLTSAPTAYGSLAVKPVDSRHPFVTSMNTRNLTYYWKVVSEGFSGVASGAVNYQFKYLPAHVDPVGDDAQYVPARYSSGWTTINDVAQVNEGNQTVAFSGVDYLDGDFTAGVPGAFSGVRTFYSIRSGIWTDTDPATTPWSTISHTGTPASDSPGTSDQVFIGDGVSNNHVIAITANGQSTGSLSIAAGSTLDVGTTTGHDFGRFESGGASSSGLLRISSASTLAEFPAGDFGLFIRETGGTVEYYTTGAQSFLIPTSSIAPTNLPLISYRHLIVTPESGASITLPDEDLTVFGNMTTQGAGSALINSASARSLDVGGNLSVLGGTFRFSAGAAQSFSVMGNITIATSAAWDMSAVGSATTHTLTLSGNIVNNGVLDFSNAGKVCNTTFVGSANASITGTGSVTDFNIITVHKGSDQTSVLNVNSSAFSLSGGNLPLVLEYGTFRLSSNQTITIANGSSFNIPAGTRLSANGGTLQLTGGDGVNVRLSGTLEVLGGAINIGTTSQDNSLEYAATGSPTVAVSGGELNVNSQIRRSTASTQGSLIYSQSGAGIVTVGRTSASSATRSVFEILNAGSSFSMTGGTLRVNRPTSSTSVADVYLHPTSFVVTGGTIEVGQGSTSQIIDIDTSIPLYNLAITGSSNGARLDSNPLVLRGSLTIDATNYFNANGLNVSIAGNLTNLNTSSSTALNAGGYRPITSTQVTTFNGSSGNQTISGAASNLTVFANLVINNSFSGGTIALQPNTALRVTSTFTLTRGILNDGGNTVTALASVLNSSTHASSGSGAIVLAGTSSQTIGGNGSGKFGNLTLNNSSGAVFSANQEVTGVLTLTNGSLSINQFGLYLSNTSLTAIAGANSTRYIITSGQLSGGGVRKAFDANVVGGTFIFPVGVSGKYSPATYTMTTGGSGGTVTVKPVNGKHPGATGPGASFITYYWNVASSGIVFTSLNQTYQYVAADEQGNPSEYRDAYFSGGTWTVGSSAGNPDPVTRIITFTNTTVAGDYTAGEPTAFVNPTVYISIASGDWESDDSVWDVDPPGTNVGPPPGSFVVISEGHTITVTSNTKRPATLDVRGRLHLGTTTGHDFGTVSATGTGARTIQIESSTFPAGDFSSFVAANSGTVEYLGSLTLPLQPVYNNLVLTGGGSKVMPNTDLTLNGNLIIESGTVNNSVSNRGIELVNSSSDFTNNGVFNAGSGSIVVAGSIINLGASAVFTGPSGGSIGIEVGGNLQNAGGASFVGGSDPITVGGDLDNDASFQAGNGQLEVMGDMTNAGNFQSGSGPLVIHGILTNNNTYSGGTGAVSVGSDFVNSGSGADYSANSNSLSITGDFRNLSNASFDANNGSIAVTGNWVNASTFDPGTSSVTFSGNPSQALTGSTTFYNLSVSNSGTLTLNDDISVTNTLTLSGSRIVTGSNSVSLANTNSQPVTGYGTSAFINGNLVISYPNTAGVSRIFPVGSGSIYRPVTIYQNAASTSAVVKVAMINVPPTGTYPTTIQGLSEARHYSINLLSGTINSPVVELSFNTNGAPDENIAIAGNARIVRATSSSGPWTDEGGSGVFSPAAPAGYATSDVTTISNPTYFALAYQAVPLPITLGDFSAHLENGLVHLKWFTHSETNNAYFTVERSASGLVYEPVATIPGAGNSKEKRYYSAVDHDPLFGISYYRLRQTDFDEQYSHSGVVMIDNSGAAQARLVVYPNPSSTNDEILLKVTNARDAHGKVVISSVTGQIFYDDVVDLSHPVDISSAIGSNPEKGVYLIRVVSETLHEVTKLLIR